MSFKYSPKIYILYTFILVLLFTNNSLFYNLMDYTGWPKSIKQNQINTQRKIMWNRHVSNMAAILLEKSNFYK